MNARCAALDALGNCPTLTRRTLALLPPRRHHFGLRAVGRCEVRVIFPPPNTRRKKKAMDIATNIDDGEEGSPWSSAVVFRVCAVADAAAAAAAAASSAPACRVELDAGRALWLQVHACFPTLQTCQLAPIGDGPILALNREDGKPFLRLATPAGLRPSSRFIAKMGPIGDGPTSALNPEDGKPFLQLATPAGFLPWMPKYEWVVRSNPMIRNLRRMNTTLVTARWKCDGSRCLAPGAPYVRVCCGALIIMDIALSAACFSGSFRFLNQILALSLFLRDICLFLPSVQRFFCFFFFIFFFVVCLLVCLLCSFVLFLCLLACLLLGFFLIFVC